MRPPPPARGQFAPRLCFGRFSSQSRLPSMGRKINPARSRNKGSTHHAPGQCPSKTTSPARTARRARILQTWTRGWQKSLCFQSSMRHRVNLAKRGLYSHWRFGRVAFSPGIPPPLKRWKSICTASACVSPMHGCRGHGRLRRWTGPSNSAANSLRVVCAMWIDQVAQLD